MQLECFPTTDRPPDIVPGRPPRAWMDTFPDRHPYRCLPLTMANTTGWEILCPIGFTAEWNGGTTPDDITLTPDHPYPGLPRLRQEPLLPRRAHLPPRLSVPHAAGLVDVGRRAAQPHQGRHPAPGRPGRDRLAAVPLHHELDLHPAGQGAASPRASRSASSPWPRTSRWRTFELVQQSLDSRRRAARPVRGLARSSATTSTHRICPSATRRP